MTSVQLPRPHLCLLDKAGGKAGVPVGDLAQGAFLHAYSQLGDEDVLVWTASPVHGLVLGHANDEGARPLVLHHLHVILQPLPQPNQPLLTGGLVADGVTRDGVCAPVGRGAVWSWRAVHRGVHTSLVTPPSASKESWRECINAHGKHGQGEGQLQEAAHG